MTLLDTFFNARVMSDALPALLRGRLGLVPFAQAALVYAHAQLGIVTRDALRVEDVDPHGPDGARVALATPSGRVVVTVAAGTSPPAQLTCRGPERARQPIPSMCACSVRILSDRFSRLPSRVKRSAVRRWWRRDWPRRMKRPVAAYFL